jgi:hypothetical protein
MEPFEQKRSQRRVKWEIDEMVLKSTNKETKTDSITNIEEKSFILFMKRQRPCALLYKKNDATEQSGLLSFDLNFPSCVLHVRASWSCKRPRLERASAAAAKKKPTEARDVAMEHHESAQ